MDIAMERATDSSAMCLAVCAWRQGWTRLFGLRERRSFIMYIYTLCTRAVIAHTSLLLCFTTRRIAAADKRRSKRVYMLHTYARNVFANAVALHSYGQTHTHAHVLLRCPPNCYTSLTNVMLIIFKKKAACALLWRIPYPIYKSLVSSEQWSLYRQTHWWSISACYLSFHGKEIQIGFIF